MIRVDNAIIMAAGTSSRFAPLSYEKHKAMVKVKGEVLIERQIEQLKDVCVPDIFVVTGYKSEQFDYLVEKYGVKLIHNSEYMNRNNNASIWAARDVLANSFVCSADNYFTENPYEIEVEDSYYAAEYSKGYTSEWCMTEDINGYINSVTIGGNKSWYMIGHTFWSKAFSNRFLSILRDEYLKEETKGKLWESIYVEHLDVLKMKIKKYSPGTIYEFDTLDELREFDESYLLDTRSNLIKRVANELCVPESDIVNVTSIKTESFEAVGFKFECQNGRYKYYYDSDTLEEE